MNTAPISQLLAEIASQLDALEFEAQRATTPSAPLEIVKAMVTIASKIHQYGYHYHQVATYIFNQVRPLALHDLKDMQSQSTLLFANQ